MEDIKSYKVYQLMMLIFTVYVGLTTHIKQESSLWRSEGDPNVRIKKTEKNLIGLRVFA